MAVVCEIIEDLNALARGKYPDLFDALERVGSRILPELAVKKKIDPYPLGPAPGRKSGGKRSWQWAAKRLT